ncbi:MAG: Crp/Fnr family transcriptional regulator [Bacteroidales bacterium]
MDRTSTKAIAYDRIQRAGAAASLSDRDHQILQFKKKQLSYEEGENLVKQGAFAAQVLYIQSGLARIFLQTGPRKQISVRVAGPGSFLGFSSLYGQETYSYSAVALKKLQACMIHKEGLRELLDENGTLAREITAEHLRDERHLFAIISVLSHQQMRGKLAHALLYLSRDSFREEDIFLHLTRQDLASFAAITTESAIRYLKEFEKAGIVDLDGRTSSSAGRRNWKRLHGKAEATKHQGSFALSLCNPMQTESVFLP